MRKNYPRTVRRDPEEYYDHVYECLPEYPNVSRFILHPRKLVMHNLCANPYTANSMEIFREDHELCYYDT